MEENIEFERCIEFLVRMIEKYGAVLIESEMAQKESKEKSDKKKD